MLKFSKEFVRLRKEYYERITSEKGIDERFNRCIQAEGMFSKLKDSMEYKRYRHRSMAKVETDTILAAIGININKLLIKIK